MSKKPVEKKLDVASYLSKSRDILVGMIDVSNRVQTLSSLIQVKKRMRRVVANTKSPSLRKETSFFYNKTASLIDGIRTRDYGKDDVKAYRKMAIKKLDLLLAETQKRLQAQIQKEEAERNFLASSDDDDDILMDSPDSTDDDSVGDSVSKLERLLRDAPDVIKKYTSSNIKQVLNLLITKKFILVRAPVIPLTKAYMDTDELKRLGFQIEKIGPYPIFENQLILGLNAKYIAKLIAEDRKKKPIDIVEKMVGMISKQQGKKFVILGPAHARPPGMYFWLASDRQVNLMAKTSQYKQLSVKRWGFAFS